MTAPQELNRFGVLAHRPEERDSGTPYAMTRPAQSVEQLWFPTPEAQLDSAIGHLINGYVVQLNGAER